MFSVNNSDTRIKNLWSFYSAEHWKKGTTQDAAPRGS